MKDTKCWQQLKRPFASGELIKKTIFGINYNKYFLLKYLIQNVIQYNIIELKNNK